MFLIDNNLSPRIAEKISIPFPNSSHVLNAGLDKSSDEEVFDYARANNFAILTKDADFYHLLNKNGYPPKVVWIRSGNVTTQYIIDLLVNNANAIQHFLGNSSVGILELY